MSSLRWTARPPEPGHPRTDSNLLTQVVRYVAEVDEIAGMGFDEELVKRVMTMVDRNIAGNTENIPLRMVPRFEKVTAMAMTIPAMRLRPRSFRSV